MKMTKWILLLLLHGYMSDGYAQAPGRASVLVDLQAPAADISPLIYGQFIEHLGHSITNGIYEEHSPLSDSLGFRLDVLEKVKELQPPILRYPGGTFTKIYHWKDGVGPKESRPSRPNLIWGGIEDNHFGTAEFVAYCRRIHAEPFLVVNMSTGTPEEAADWVEYCNGTGNTYYANLRRAHGYPEPFGVKYWGLGNEEYAVEDAGTHQDPDKYVQDGWQYVKLMKLTDTGIKLILVGSQNGTWTNKVLKGLGPVCDYLSLHLYARSGPGGYNSLFENILGQEKNIIALDSLLQQQPAGKGTLTKWYRFPPRKQSIQLAIDEWGIWEEGGRGPYDLEVDYEWKQALGVGLYLNMFQRHSDRIGLATWAQLVNVLAPIMTTKEGSFRQTVFYPLEYFRKYCGDRSLHTSVRCPMTEKSVDRVTPGRKGVGRNPMGSLADLDAAASFSRTGRILTITMVNISCTDSLNTGIALKGGRLVRLVGETILRGKDDIEKRTIGERDRGGVNDILVPPSSIVICRYQVE